MKCPFGNSNSHASRSSNPSLRPALRTKRPRRRRRPGDGPGVDRVRHHGRSPGAGLRPGQRSRTPATAEDRARTRRNRGLDTRPARTRCDQQHADGRRQLHHRQRDTHVRSATRQPCTGPSDRSGDARIRPTRAEPRATAGLMRALWVGTGRHPQSVAADSDELLATAVAMVIPRGYVIECRLFVAALRLIAREQQLSGLVRLPRLDSSAFLQTRRRKRNPTSRAPRAVTDRTPQGSVPSTCEPQSKARSPIAILDHHSTPCQHDTRSRRLFCMVTCESEATSL
jgi:hypothetical protein